MGMIQFVANHDDLSSDKGYQFKFYCDKCRNGYVSRFVPSKIGMASSILRTAGSVFGGWMSSAGHGSYDLQRMIGGPEHDSAMRDALLNRRTLSVGRNNQATQQDEYTLSTYTKSTFTIQIL